jgi:CheY-like chemotaxis protein
MTSKILIVEDDRDIRRHLKRLLEMEDYRVDCAENGRVAIDLLQATHDLPAVIILDLMMPVMDGVAFREEQLKTSRIASIPVVIMSADSQAEEKNSHIGADAVLKKPADIDVILRVVDQLSGRTAG